MQIEPYGKTLILNKSSNEKIGQFLSANEMKCNCGKHWCAVTFVSRQFIKCFDNLRLLVDGPVHVSSGYRCQYHNHINVEGASLKSRHLTGEAADLILPEHLCLDSFARMARQAGFSYVKKYTNPSRIHVDVR